MDEGGLHDFWLLGGGGGANGLIGTGVVRVRSFSRTIGSVYTCSITIRAAVNNAMGPYRPRRRWSGGHWFARRLTGGRENR